MTDKPGGLLAAAVAATQVEATTDVPCAACGGTGKIPLPLPYRCFLRSGIAFIVYADLEPEKLQRYVDSARKGDGTILWKDGQVTEARQIAHLAPYEGEDDEGNEASEGSVPTGILASTTTPVVGERS